MAIPCSLRVIEKILPSHLENRLADNGFGRCSRLLFPCRPQYHSRKSLSHDRSVPTWFQHNNWPPLSRSRLVTSDTAPCDWTWTCMHNLLFLTKPLSDQIGRPRQRIPNVPHDRHPGASQRIVLSTARDCRPRPQRRRQVEHTERAECWLAI